MENTFNTNIKRIRREKGITQEQLADAVGVSPQAVSKWETSSYPDAQLLPAIADALGVTIDILFGRGEDELSIENRIIEYMKSIDQKDRLSSAFRLCRAMCMGGMGCEKYVSIDETTLKAENWETYSQITWESGIVQSRLCGNLQYFLLIPEPECGYDKILAYDEEMVEFLSFLGSRDALRVLYYIAGKSTGMFFNDKTLCSELDISKDRAKEIISLMLKFKLIWEADFNGGKTSEKIYQYLADCNFISFLTFARTLMKRPCGYNYQTNDRLAPYLKNDTYKQCKKV